MKLMNLKTKDVPGLKAAWGTIKSNYIKKSVGTAVLKGHVGRKRLRKAIDKNPGDFSTDYSQL
jgi:hypothetical protein